MLASQIRILAATALAAVCLVHNSFAAENDGSASQDPVESLKPAVLPDQYIKPSCTLSKADGLIGTWRGRWEGTLDTYLVVNAEDAKTIQGYYAWGGNLIIKKPGSVKIVGYKKGDDVLIMFSDETSLVFTTSSDKTILGVAYTTKSQKPSRIVLHKVDGSDNNLCSTGE